MAVATQHGLYAVIHDDTAIPGITQLGLSLGGTTIGEVTAAELYPRNMGVNAQNPQITFNTRALATALGLIGFTGTDISSLAAGMTFYEQKFSEGGGRAGITSHRKIVVNEGIAIPQRISVSHQQNAELTYQVLVTFDGTNDPYVLTENQTLPSAPSDAERFTIGKTTLGGVLLTQINSVEIDFGIQAMAEGSDSDIWPTFSGIEQSSPTITLRGTKAEWWGTAGLDMAGLAATHANTIIYLRKRTSTGFVPDITAEHIKITANGIAQLTDLFTAQGTRRGEVGIVLTCDYDGTNAPITLTTASAIT